MGCCSLCTHSCICAVPSTRLLPCSLLLKRTGGILEELCKLRRGQAILQGDCGMGCGGSTRVCVTESQLLCGPQLCWCPCMSLCTGRSLAQRSPVLQLRVAGAAGAGGCHPLWDVTRYGMSPAAGCHPLQGVQQQSPHALWQLQGAEGLPTRSSAAAKTSVLERRISFIVRRGAAAAMSLPCTLYGSAATGRSPLLPAALFFASAAPWPRCRGLLEPQDTLGAASVLRLSCAWVLLASGSWWAEAELVMVCVPGEHKALGR